MLSVLKKALGLAASQAMTEAVRIVGTKRLTQDGRRLKRRRELGNDGSSAATEEKSYLFWLWSGN